MNEGKVFLNCVLRHFLFDLLLLVLNLADIRALSGVHEVPWCEVEDEGIGIETHGDGEEQEGGAASKLHEVHLLPVES